MRFPGFTDEWERVKVSDLLDFYSTNSLSWEMLNYEDGDIQNLHYGLIHSGLPTLIDLKRDTMPFVNETAKPKKFALCKEGDIAFADASEDTNDVAKAVEFINLNGQQVISGLHTIHGRDKENKTVLGFKGYAFASSAFHNQIRRIAQGTKIYSISSKSFDEVFIGIPNKAEQTKIARLLHLIDERIATQNKIIEDLIKLKSAIIDKVFCLPSEKQPNKRLDGFSGDWKRVTLSEICERITDKNSDLKCNLVLTIAAQYGLVSQLDFFNKSVASENLSSYYILKKGDFAYNKSYSGEYVWGAIKKLEYYEEGVLSPLYICFRPNQEMINHDFLAFYFESKKWHRGISEIAGEGARNHGLLNISVIDFFNTIHRIPSLLEQSHIASLLQSYQNKIHNEEKLLLHYQTQRKYLLTSMFI